MFQRTILGVLAFFLCHAAAAKETQRPILIELYTSQGCHSCPPADAFAGELSLRDDVLPLSFHVDYWNYIGWKDPFSKAAFTTRQKQYARMEGQGRASIYTPQMVIDGRLDIPGTNKAQVEKVIDHMKKDMETVAINVQHTDKTIKIDIGAFTKPGLTKGDIWLVGYDREHVTRVARGENKGKTLTNYNVVESLEHLASWRGAGAFLGNYP
jgi:hypothetical protein